jgi:hypothetical protein
MKGALVFCAIVLSFLQFGIDGAGSFIALDFASLLYFGLHPRRLLKNESVWICLLVAACALTCTWIFVGANEFPFLIRLALIFVDAFFLNEVFRPEDYSSQEVTSSNVLLLGASAYVAAFLIWWIFVPEGNDTIFYMNVPKQWIATFPAIFAASQLVAGRNKAAMAFALASSCLSFYDSSASRALLLQSSLMFFVALWRENRTAAKLLVVIAGFTSLLSLATLDEFVEKHDHSNTFRLVMMLQIFEFSTLETIFGRGIELWRKVAFEVLFEMPGAEEFFEAANPHFFPAELMIRGGLALFVSVFAAFYVVARRASAKAVAFVMLAATFFTTNTGVERLYMSLAIFVLISTSVRRSETEVVSASTLNTVDSEGAEERIKSF